MNMYFWSKMDLPTGLLVWLIYLSKLQNEQHKSHIQLVMEIPRANIKQATVCFDQITTLHFPDSLNCQITYISHSQFWTPVCFLKSHTHFSFSANLCKVQAEVDARSLTPYTWTLYSRTWKYQKNSRRVKDFFGRNSQEQRA